MEQNFIVLAALFGVMYFLLIRPQKKQIESRKKMMESLSADDIITTIGGIKGRVVSVSENSIILEIAENVKIELMKSAVGQIVSEDDEEYEEYEEELEETDEEIDNDSEEDTRM